MKTKKEKRLSLNTIKKSIFAVLLSLAILLSPQQKAQAALWPAIDPIIKQGLEVVQKHIDGVILGALKQQAAKMLNSQISKLMGGSSSGSAQFITNWQDYLVKQPKNNTKTYMNDYLSKVTAGKGSASGYQSKSEGFGTLSGLLGSSSSGSSSSSSLTGTLKGLLSSSSSSGGSYSSQLVQMAKKTTVDQKDPKMTYEGNPSQMFSGGNFKNLGQFLSGINNPWTFDANAQKEYQKKLAEEKKIAETKSIAYQGFKGTGEKNGKGNISTPGSVKKDAVSNVQDIGNKIISSATHPEEIITSIVSQMINKALSQGLGNMDKVISKELSSVSGLSSILKTSTSKNGPAAAYKSSSSGVSTSSLMDGH